MRDRMIELNNTINWKPESTGTGRFGKWLENLQDWNLSRSRFWGTPLPIWRSEDGKEEICIGSVAELKSEIEKSMKSGFMNSNPLANFIPENNSKENFENFDLHKPFVDEIILVSPSGKKMLREADLIDVWFDSGAMPYGQLHYPFENSDLVDNGKFFPADFVAEGVDQTRGWFFTLHAIAVMLFDSVAFKNIISNGLVLDKNGNKMSKRLGNAVDPFETIGKYGSDPLRWYMISNASPWDNLKFDVSGIEETVRKFFGTLYNTYSFFSLYANVDSFAYKETEVPVSERLEIDRWIISLLNSLISEVDSYYADYEPTKAARAISNFVTENLSNWYVRLNRKRYWGGEFTKDKIAAYQTLYTCLEIVAKLAAPIAPFFSDRLFADLNLVTGRDKSKSVHLALFPQANIHFIDKTLEVRMDIAQKVSSMVLGLRRKVNIKVRQPLSLMRVIQLNNEHFPVHFVAVRNLILSETNVKEALVIEDIKGTGIIKKIKLDYKKLGPRFGKLMKQVAEKTEVLTQEDILNFEIKKSCPIQIGNQNIELYIDEVEIQTEDIPGLLVANEGTLTVILDTSITEELRQEGIAREFINRIQNLRKDNGFDVTDKINIEIQKHEALNNALDNHREYIKSQTLALGLQLVDNLENDTAKLVDIEEEIQTLIRIERI
jgi:isoleucyl-tRNA synthetase